MKYLSILIVLIIGGCGKKLPQPKGYIDPEFIEIVRHFEATYNVKVYVSLEFAESLEDSSVGVCHSFQTNSPSNWIEIKKGYWDNINYYAKEQLIFHELGHCVFGYGHDESYIEKDGYSIPKSIMYPVCFGHNWYYEYYNNYYLQELRP